MMRRAARAPLKKTLPGQARAVRPILTVFFAIAPFVGRFRISFRGWVGQIIERRTRLPWLRSRGPEILQEAVDHRHRQPADLAGQQDDHQPDEAAANEQVWHVWPVRSWSMESLLDRLGRGYSRMVPMGWYFST